jgi:hypothetical protein
VRRPSAQLLELELEVELQPELEVEVELEMRGWWRLEVKVDLEQPQLLPVAPLVAMTSRSVSTLPKHR